MRLGFLKAIESIIYVLDYVVSILTLCTQSETVHLNRQSTMNIKEEICHERRNTVQIFKFYHTFFKHVRAEFRLF